MMILRGYSEEFVGVDVDALTFDAWDLVTTPGFWPAHLGDVVDDEELLAEAWGVDEDTVRATYQRLSSSAAWPVFAVDLGGGARLAAVWRNYDEDAAMDFLIVPAGEQDCILLATVGGNHVGPGISWAELAGLAERAERAGLAERAELAGLADRQPDPLRRAHVLLVFLPMMADEKASSKKAAKQVRKALKATGASGDLDELVEWLVSENACFGPVPWGRADGGTTICEDVSSPRSPGGSAALEPASLRLVSDLLTLSG
ncbi:hypothetical protein [Actinoplanes sp. NPDC023714]|uniref:hypothetical protein n=1 Tax=Actinoplanes sp. NPDC023714 TaxID=3154322 RepID=UPI0033E5A5B5